MHEGELAARLGLPGIPAAAELIMAERDLALAELTGGRLLLDMLSSAQTLPALKRAKATRRESRSPASTSITSCSTSTTSTAIAPSPSSRRRCAAKTTATRSCKPSATG